MDHGAYVDAITPGGSRVHRGRTSKFAGVVFWSRGRGGIDFFDVLPKSICRPITVKKPCVALSHNLPYGPRESDILVALRCVIIDVISRVGVFHGLVYKGKATTFEKQCRVGPTLLLAAVGYFQVLFDVGSEFAVALALRVGSSIQVLDLRGRDGLPDAFSSDSSSAASCAMLTRRKDLHNNIPVPFLLRANISGNNVRAGHVILPAFVRPTPARHLSHVVRERARESRSLRSQWIASSNG